MNYCIDCFKPILDKSTRCHSCANKLIQIKTRSKKIESIKKNTKQRRNKKLSSYLCLYEIKKQIMFINIEKYVGNISANVTNLCREHEKLYYSILEYIKYFEPKYNYVRLNIKHKAKLILDGMEKSTCHCGKTIKWDYKNEEFQKICKCCNINIKTLQYYQIKFGKDVGKQKYQEQIEIQKKAKNNKMLSLTWFISKYGEEGQKNMMNIGNIIFQKERKQNTVK